MSKLIVGLGNPEVRYELTRHNIGWQLLDYLGDQQGLIWKEKYKGLVATKTIDGEQWVFLKPHTYMNCSGESVAPAATFFKVSVEDILVVHDELDLSYGVISFKKGGGLAGHNGLKSIASSLGSQDFKRLRMGIGRPDRGSVSSWVLSTYSDDQMSLLEDYLKGTYEKVVPYIDKGSYSTKKQQIVNYDEGE